MRNIADKTDNVSNLSAAEFNFSIMQEAENVVLDTGITLDGASGPDTDAYMLSQAITRAAQGANRYQDGGSANTYTLTAVRAYRQPAAYIDGMTVVFKVGNTNTGASTINVSSIGSKSLVSAAGAALTGGELTADKYAIATYDSTSDKFQLVLENESSLVSSLEKTITQASHGFAVGDVVKLSGTSYAKAQADSAANAEVVGMVSAVADTDNFTLKIGGVITGLSGLTAGTLYYLDASTAGDLTATEPSYSKPVFIADTTTSGYFYNFRGTGESQTWTDVTGSRSVSTTYTNTTGKRIEVIISAVAVSDPTVVVSINSITNMGNSSQGVSGDDYASVTFTVPDGDTYELTSSNGTLKWVELR